jgi:hypothetical protein
MMLESGHYGHGFEVIAGRANAIKAGFTGNDFEKDPTILSPAVGGDDFAIPDGERREPIGFCGDLLRAGTGNERERSSGGLEKFSTIHHVPSHRREYYRLLRG